MLFNSYLFVFAFLPVVLLMWYGANRLRKPRFAQIALVLLSLIFYGYGHPEYIVLILASVLGNYGVSQAMEYFGARSQNAKRMHMIWGIVGITFNLGLLFYFKYYDFFVRNVNRLADTGLSVKNIALPLGISFFTFQQISFIADRMCRRAPHYAMLDYLNFVTFFPQLVAGPIVNHKNLVPQFQKIGSDARTLFSRAEWEGEETNRSSIEMGVCLFIAGLAKKVLLADKLGIIVDYGYGNMASLDALSAFVVMLCYTFQIYFDFSGYCDMAVGIGWMLHINLPENFNSPYKACSIKDFWNRWHITLNAFFTQYVYIPLGGSRCGTGKHLCNIMIVFLLSGIWHGAAWSFVAWGLAHGVMMCIEPLFAKLAKGVRWFITFAFVNLAWVLFRSGSFGMALQFYRALFSFSYTGKIWELADKTAGSWNYLGRFLLEMGGGNKTAVAVYYMIVLLALLVLAAFLCTRRNAYERVREREISAAGMWGLALLFAMSVISFAGVTTFLYFNF